MKKLRVWLFFLQKFGQNLISQIEHNKGGYICGGIYKLIFNVRKYNFFEYKQGYRSNAVPQ